jgi:hypothetical protein
MNKALLYFILPLAGWLLCGVALGQWSPDAETCAMASGPVNEKIEACTRAITSGQLSSANLAITFYNRGTTWYSTRDDEHAIADYNEGSGSTRSLGRPTGGAG